MASGPVASVRTCKREATGVGAGARGQRLIDGGLLKAVEQLTHRLVDPGDAATAAVPGMTQT